MEDGSAPACPVERHGKGTSARSTEVTPNQPPRLAWPLNVCVTVRNGLPLCLKVPQSRARAGTPAPAASESRPETKPVVLPGLGFSKLKTLKPGLQTCRPSRKRAVGTHAAEEIREFRKFKNKLAVIFVSRTHERLMLFKNLSYPRNSFSAPSGRKRAPQGGRGESLWVVSATQSYR